MRCARWLTAKFFPNLMPLAVQMVHFLDEGPGVHHHSVPDDAERSPIEDAGGIKMENKRVP